MSSMNSVMNAIAAAGGPVSMGQLADVVDMDASAVEGIIRLLVRKGKLRDVQAETCNAAACGSCAYSGPSGCPLTFKDPRRFEISCE